jgi:DNA-binding Lrp family transcriptional regulator
MDAVDREILAILRDDGRITATDLAKRIRLGLSATSERLRQLQRSGVIRRFTVDVDPAATGRPIEALVDVRLAPGTRQSILDETLQGFPAIVDATHLTGRFDTQLRVAAADVAELDQLLIALKEDLGAEETNTRLVLRTIEGFPRAAL